MNALLGLFRPKGRHHAGRHAAPRPARRTREVVDDYDATTMALFDQWNLPLKVVRHLVGSTLTATKSIDVALQMTQAIRALAVTGGAR